jgi:hypothetical protein
LLLTARAAAASDWKGGPQSFIRVGAHCQRAVHRDHPRKMIVSPSHRFEIDWVYHERETAKPRIELGVETIVRTITHHFCCSASD